MSTRLIIADDEAQVREGLKNMVPWQEMDIEVVGIASDGEEALELCQKLKPDILITDIRMPLMDGLELAARLRELEEHTYIVIISGFQDFRYAQTALSMNVDAYLLKPVKIEELTETMQKITKRIEREMNSTQAVESLKKQLDDHLPVIRDRFLANWLTGYYKSEQDIREKLNYFRLADYADKPLYCGALRIDDYEQAILRFSEEHKQLISFSILNVAGEILSQSSAGLVFVISENAYGLLLWKSPERHQELCREIIITIKRFLKLPVSIGLGKKASLTDIHKSYNQAVSALQHTYYTGSHSMVLYEDIQQATGESMEPSYILELQQHVLSQMKAGLSEQTERAVIEIFDRIKQETHLTPEYVQSLCTDLLYACQRTLMEFGENYGIVEETLPQLIHTVHKQANLEHLQSFMVALLVRLADHFGSKYSQKNVKDIHKIKEYIHKNYMHEITINTLSELISLSPNYISIIFKKGTGQTVTDYILSVRMENAKELLKDKDLKILDIAEMVGYENTNYFSTVFKKYCGMHPGKFRQMLEGSEG